MRSAFYLLQLLVLLGLGTPPVLEVQITFFLWLVFPGLAHIHALKLLQVNLHIESVTGLAVLKWRSPQQASCVRWIAEHMLGLLLQAKHGTTLHLTMQTFLSIQWASMQ